MSQPARKVPAAEFKAKCLALLDQVARSGLQLIVTKRGKPVAQVGPVDQAGPPSLRGSIVRERDIVSPSGERWAADR